MDIIRKNIEEMNMRLAKTLPVIPENNSADDKLRFMLVSTHIQQVTGYSKVAYNLVKQISNIPHTKLYHFGFQRQGVSIERTYPAGVEAIDAGALETAKGKSEGGFGFSVLPDMIKVHKPHIVMIYNDLSIVHQFMDSIRKSGIERNFKVWVYADQIYNIQQQPFLDTLNREADRIFAFSDYWRNVLKVQGIHRPIHLIHHGFEKADFPILPKAETRKGLGIAEKSIVFMSLNRNQPRKRLDLLVMAFADLVVKHPQLPIYLIMVCDKGDKGGWNIFDIYSREIKLHGGQIDGFADRLLITSKDMAYSDKDIVALYNIADVGVSCAEGEGWGLCSFEMMGIGKPQVVSDVGGHKEFCNAENSIIVPVKSRYYLPTCYCNLGGEAGAVDHLEFSRAMERYVLDSELREKHGAAAREKVGEYTWEKVCGQLKKQIGREFEDLHDSE